jgi:hypothetical protein
MTAKELGKILCTEFKKDEWGKVDPTSFGNPQKYGTPGFDDAGLYDVLERAAVVITKRFNKPKKEKINKPAKPFDLSQLKHGENRVRARFARRDNFDGDAPDWQESKMVTLMVHIRDGTKRLTKRILPLPVSHNNISVTVLDFEWAEYGSEDYCPESNEFLVEDYRMQIIEVRENK